MKVAGAPGVRVEGCGDQRGPLMAEDGTRVGPRAVNDLGRHLVLLADDLAAAFRSVLSSGWLVLGEQGRRFEEAFADYCGVDHCVSVANGTDALEIALRSVGVGGGDDVVTVANAGMYGSAAILAIGARPVYVDIDPATLLIDLEDLERRLGRSRQPPAAVLITHLYGQPVDMGAATSIASRSGIPVVEDCAQAHGASWSDRRCGGWGAASAFSFYPTKNLGAIGDAGAVVTASDEVAAIARELRQYGWSAKYVATRAGGRNSRMDEVQAAVLHLGLRQLEDWNARRRAIVEAYSREIVHRDVTVPGRGGPGDVGHLFVLRSRRRDELRSHLASYGIGTDVHYPVPDHRQGAVEAVLGRSEALPETEAACDEVLTLPCFPEMTDAEVEYVIEAVRSW